MERKSSRRFTAEPKKVEKAKKAPSRTVSNGRMAALLVCTLVAFSAVVFLSSGPDMTEGGSEEIWDGQTYDLQFAGGTGTQADPYQIETANQMFLLAQLFNNKLTTAEQATLVANHSATNINAFKGTSVYYKQTGNIYLNDVRSASSWGEGLRPQHEWTPISNFSSNFDGGGKTINGVFIYATGSTGNDQGFFSYVGSAVTIKNVNVEKSFIRGAQNVGGIAGRVASGILLNCHFSGRVTSIGASSTSNVGGIVGSINTQLIGCVNEGTIQGAMSNTGGVAGICTAVMTGCINKGIVMGAAYTGGIAGVCDAYAITDCYNMGSVSGTTPVGGIVSSSSSNANRAIKGCFNSGDIKGSNGNIGGIIGSGNGNISDSYNTGNLYATYSVYSATVNTYYAGGIMGTNVSSNVGALSNVYNTGNIYITSTLNPTAGYAYYVGGVVGSNTTGSIANAYNTGDINVTSLVATANSSFTVAGVVANNTGIMSELYNKGALNITTKTAVTVAGITPSTTNTLKNVYNEGKITVDTSSGTNASVTVSGIANAPLETCYNLGDIKVTASGSATVAGIRLSSSYSTTSYCYNLGNISVTSTGAGVYVGGVISSSSNNGGGTSTVKNCFNKGNIECRMTNDNYSGSYIGGVIGVNYVSNVSDVYNTGNIKVICGIGTGNNLTVYVGGVIGMSSHYQFSATLGNLYNEGDVYLASTNNGTYMGGVLGRMDISGNSQTPCSNFYNKGNITNAGSGVNTYIGGVMGSHSVSNSSAGTNSNLTQMYNEGKVETAASLGNTIYMGGVVGQINGTIYTTLQYNYNKGDVTSRSVANNQYIGGIFGYASQYRDISYSYNTGAVTCDSTGADNIRMGGIGGSSYSAVSQSYNEGAIRNSSVGNSSFVGGILGESSRSTGAGSMTNCYNKGTVINNGSGSGAFAGGIVGSMGAGTSVTSCYNLADITNGSTYNAASVGSNSPCVGGLVGYSNGNSSYQVSITNSFNKGLISYTGPDNTYSCIGGLAGHFSTYANIYRSYNTGNITGDAGYAGGISGYSGGTNGTFQHLYNLGDILDSSTYAGGLFGQIGSTANQSYTTGKVGGSGNNKGVFAGRSTVAMTLLYCLDDALTDAGGVTVGLGTVPSSYYLFDASGATSPGSGANPAGATLYLSLNSNNAGVWTNVAPFPTLTAAITEGSITFIVPGHSVMPSITIPEVDFRIPFINFLPEEVPGQIMPDGQVIWDGSTATAFAGGDGSVMDPYQISNGKELAFLAAKVNSNTAADSAYQSANYIITKDIYLNNIEEFSNWPVSGVRSWTVYIGNSTARAFMGTIDGQQYSIYGLYFSGSYGNASLFSYSSGTINNIDLKYSYLQSSSTSGANLAGIVANNLSGGKLNNCSFEGKITSYQAASGGLVSQNAGEITGSHFSGSLTSNYNTTGAAVGGIAAVNNGTITDCYNTGDLIQANTVSSINVSNAWGGIAGQNYGSITGCYNKGSLDIKNRNSGGIAGYGYANSSIEDCQNYGNLTLNYAYASYAGGIIGFHAGSNIKNCLNSGDITSSSPISSIGGIVGQADGTAVNITDSYNNGKITLTSGTASSNIGGIAGISSGNISNCFNAAPINAVKCSSIGGIVGNKSGGTVEKCYNDSNITTDGSYIGGIVGTYNAAGTVSECYNTGNITSATGNYIGGIVGMQSAAGSITDRCYNLGDIFGGGTVGGIVGYNSSQSAVTNIYNRGNITATGDSAGGLVGTNTAHASITASQCRVVNGSNHGTVSGARYVGGVIGTNGAYALVENTYSTGLVTSTTVNSAAGIAGTNNTNGIVRYSYFLDISAPRDMWGAAGTFTTSFNVNGGMNGTGFNSATTVDLAISSWASVNPYTQWFLATGSNFPTLDLRSVLYVWDGSSSLSLSGSGTADSPYLIRTSQDLAFLVTEVNSGNTNFAGLYFRMTRDIYINHIIDWELWGTSVSPDNQWNPIGNNSVRSFGGTFDGSGFRVFGLFIDDSDAFRGLFGNSSGTIVNLGVVNSFIRTDNDRVGGIAGNSTGEIQNCHFEGRIFGGSYVGGIAGYSNGAISDCTSMGIITGSSYVGGIAGEMGAMSSAEMTFNGGHVKGTGDYVGGIAGYTGGDIYYSQNNGEVSGYNYVGGIAGSSKGDIVGCYSVNKVSGKGGWVGGIAGYSEGNVTQSYNLNSVIGLDYVGGIVGQSSTAVRITNSHNSGSVRGKMNVGGISGRIFGDIESSVNLSSVSGSDDLVGGLAGYITGSIIDSRSSGDVAGAMFSGGIAGHSVGGMSNTYALGSVQGSSYVGGLAGSTEGDIHTSYSNGSVTASVDYAGGITGHNNAEILSSYSTGAVTAVNYAGGIAGYNENDIINSFNNGRITASGEFAGGIAGYSEGSIVNTYSTGQISAGGHGGGIAGHSTGTVRVSFYLGTGASGAVDGVDDEANEVLPFDSGGLVTISGITYAFIARLNEDIRVTQSERMLNFIATSSAFSNGSMPAYLQTALVFEVRLDFNHDNLPVEVIPVISGQSIRLPTPLRTGYLFRGWSIDGGSSLVLGGTLITPSQNMSYVAYWDPGQFSVSYNLNGAGGVTPPNTVMTFDSPALPLEVVSRANHTFDGWATQDTGGNFTMVTDANGAFTVSGFVDGSGNWVYPSNLRLYAMWTPYPFKIDFNLNGGGTTDQSPLTVYAEETVPVLTSTTVRNGCDFLGWFTAPSGGDKLFDENGNPQTVAGLIDASMLWIGTGDTVVYAHWFAHSFDIRFDPSAGTAVADLRVTIGDKPTFGVSAWDGRDFLGWATTAAGDVMITDRNGVLRNNVVDTTVDPFVRYTEADGSWAYANDLTVHAVWKFADFTLTLNPGSGAVNPATMTVTYQTQVGTSPIPTLKGHTFSGWFTAASGGTKLFDGAGNPVDGAGLILGGKWNVTSDADVFAQWTANTYAINYNANGGTVNGVNPGSFVFGSDAVSLPVATKRGYVFQGWAISTDGSFFLTDASGNIFQNVAGHTVNGKWDFAGNLTLNAIWNVGVYTVTLDATGGTTGQTPFTIEFGRAAPSWVQIASREGFDFLGWFTEPVAGSMMYTASGTLQDVPNLIEGGLLIDDRNITLYAHWGPKQFRLTFDASPGTTTLTYRDVILGSTTPSVAAVNTRTGYTFAGWETSQGIMIFDSTGTPISNSDYISATGAWKFASDLDLFAVWTPRTFVISFNSNGGLPVSDRNVAFDSGLPSLGVTTREGYRFNGWAATPALDVMLTDASGNVKNVSGIVENGVWKRTSNLTVYATWTAEQYTITFNAQGGTPVPSNMTVTFGGTVGQFSDAVTRTGHILEGWYTSATGGVMVFNQNGQPVNASGFIQSGTWVHDGNVVVFARWTTMTSTITFVSLESGASLPSSVQVSFGDTLATLPVASALGFTFKGWAVDSSLTPLLTGPGGVVFSNVSGFTQSSSWVREGNVVLFAVWEASSFTIEFDGNGADGGGGVSDITADYNTRVTLPSSGFTLTGQRLAGWSTQTTGPVEYRLGQSILMPFNGLKLYAVWEKGIFSVNFNSNSGSGVISAMSGYYGDEITLPGIGDGISRTGYELKGWSTTSTGPVSYALNARFTIPNGDTLLFAVWEVNQYKIEFDPDNGAGAVFDITGPFHQLIQLPASAPGFTLAGHQITGWSTGSGGTGTVFRLGESIIMPSGGMKLYAVWEPIVYTVTFNGNEGTISPSFVSGNHTETILFPNIANKTGHDLKGWAKDPNETNPSNIFNNPSGLTFTENTTYYAIWKVQEFTVTLMNLGSQFDTASVAFGSTLYLGQFTPINPNHVLIGWGPIATSATYAPNATITVTGDMTLHAVWSSGTVTVTFNVTDGTGGPATQTFATGQASAITTQVPTHDSWQEYRFAGWATSSGGFVSYVPGELVTFTQNTDLYVVWELIVYTVTFNGNGGTISPSYDSGNYGQFIRFPDTAIKTGHTLKGWAKDPNEANPSNIFNNPNSVRFVDNTTYYAIWEAKTFTVTLMNGPAQFGTASVAFGSTLYLGQFSPTNSNNVLIGWGPIATSATYTPNGTVTVTGDMTLHAVWSLGNVIVTFNVTGGTGGPTTQTFAMGQASTLTTLTPTHNQPNVYQFAGWATSSGGFVSYVPGELVTFTENTDLYSVWELILYTVTFNGNGGTISPSFATGNYDDTITFPTTANKTGHNLKGWAKDPNESNPSNIFNAGDGLKFTENTTYYAIWEAKTFTVTLMSDGSQFGTASVAFGSTLYLGQFTPIKAGHVLIGWGPTATSATYTTNATITVTGDMTLHAVWSLGNVTVTFNVTDGTGGPATQTFATGQASTLTTLTPTHNNPNEYRFAGWALTSGGSPAHMPGELVSFTSDTTLYSAWEKIVYTVTFNGNGGTISPLYDSGNYSIAITFPGTASNTGHTLSGWAKDPNETDTSKIFNNSSGLTFTENTTYYAIWVADEFDVKIYSQENIIHDVRLAFGSTLYLGQFTPTRDGHALIGWGPSQSSATYTPNGTVTVTGPVTLHAVWSATSVNVTFNVNDGTGGPATQAFATGQASTLTTLTPTHNQPNVYQFAGWATSSGGFVSYVPGELVTFTENTDLYSVWELILYTVTFNGNGGTISPSFATGNYGDTLTFPTTANKTGHDLKGWAKDPNETNPSNIFNDSSGLTFTENTTYYAIWEAQTFTVTLMNGSAQFGTANVAFGSTLYLGQFTPTREGFMLIGWGPIATSATYAPSATITVTGDMTLHAVWSSSKVTVTFNVTDGTGGPATQAFATGQASTLTTLTPTHNQPNVYQFAGWATSSGGFVSYVPGELVTFTENTDLYSVWELILYTVTFNGNGGTISPSFATGNYGDTLTFPTTANKTGHDLKGWAKDPNETNPSNIFNAGDGLKFTENTTYYAIWVAQTFTVTLMNLGSQFGTANVDFGSTLDLSQFTPTNGGYTLIGWGPTASSAVYAPSAIMVVTGNMTLHAVWSTDASPITLAFNVTGGTGGPPTSQLIAGQPTTIPTSIPTHNQPNVYRFAGWATSSGGFVSYVPGELVTFTSNTVLYVVWEKIVYTVTFDGNGGTISPSFRTGNYGDTLLFADTASNTGHTLSGWAKDPNETDTSKIFNNSSGLTFTENTTYYAIWVADEFDVKIYSQENIIHDVRLAFGSTLYLGQFTPTREGHALIGWGPIATSATYTPNGTVTVTGPVTLHAVWSATSVNVTFNVNDGTGGPTTQAFATGQSSTLTTLTPTHNQPNVYQFAGWATSSGGPVSYVPGELVTFTENTDLYSVWELIVYTVTFNGNGGTISPSFATGNYDDTITFPTTANKTGHNLKGWAKDPNETNPSNIFNAGDGLKFTENTTYYAIWEAKTFTVTLMNGSAQFGTANVAFGSTLYLGQFTPTREGFMLIGWGPIATSATYAPSATITVTGDMTLYAVWSASKVTVTFNVTDGTGGPTTQAFATGQASTLTTLTPTHNNPNEYRFAGWALTNGGPASYVPGELVTFTENTDLYSVWELIVYTVTFNGTGGTISSSSDSGNYGEFIEFPHTANKTGHTLKGWARDPNETDTSKIFNNPDSVRFTENTTYYAIWEAGTFKVTLMSFGSEFDYANVLFGSTLYLGQFTPTNSGHVLIGWGPTPSSATYTPNGTVTVTGNMTLHAVWSVSTVTVTFNVTDGTGGPATQTFAIGQPSTLTLQVPIHNNSNVYRFAGWATSSGGPVVYVAGELVTFTSNTVLYVVWENIVYTVTFDGNGGTISPSFATGNYDDTITFPTTANKTGHDLKGWAKDPNETDTSKIFNDSSGLTFTENTTYYAIWVAQTFTVTLMNNNSQFDTVSVAFGSTLYLGQFTPINPNHVLIGWGPNTTSATYTTNATITVTGNMTLHAVWSATSVNVTFNVSGGTGGPTTQAFAMGQASTLTTLTPTHNQPNVYRFAGWATSSGGPVSYVPGELVTFTQNTDLYAVWELIVYTVTFNGNGGTISPSFATGNYGDTLTFPHTASKTGHNLKGWAKDPNETNPSNIFNNLSGLTFTENTTYYAIWVAQTFTVTLMNNNSQFDTVSVAFGSTLYLGQFNPIKVGHVLIGWGPSQSSATYAPSATITVTGNMTLHAVWSVSTVTVTFNVTDGTGGPTTQAFATGQASTLTTLTPTHNQPNVYRFAGWATSNGGQVSYVPGELVTFTENTDLYAVWELIVYTVTFNGNGGTISPSFRTGNYGQPIIFPNVANNTGHTLKGWAKDPNETNPSNIFNNSSGLTFTENTTYFAIWEPTMFTVTLMNLGSQFGTASVAFGSTLDLGLFSPTNPNHVLIGWGPTATSATYAPGAIMVVTGNMTLHAVWVSVGNDYVITFSNNGGSGSIPSVPANNGDVIRLPGIGDGIYRNGYRLDGWNTAPNGSGTNYSLGQNYTVRGNATLYAVWVSIGNDYVISFNSNGGSGSIPAVSADNGDIITLPGIGAGIYRNGYTLDGWNTAPNGSGTNYSLGQNYTVRGDATLYAVWKINTYTITATSGGNGSITPSGVIIVNHGGSETFTFQPSQSYQIRSVTIDGVINDAARNNGFHTFTSVSGNHTIHVEFEPIDRDLIITATTNWGGTITPSGDVSVRFGGDISFTVKVNNGYAIRSVKVDGILVSLVDSKYTFSNVTSNHTIEVEFFMLPEYVPLNVSVSKGGHVEYSINGSAFQNYVGEVAVLKGASVTLRAVPGHGYEFGGWSGDISSDEAQISIDDVQSAKDLKASFTYEPFGSMYIILLLVLILIVAIIAWWRYFKKSN